jgi:hypothetical protein
MSSIPKSLNFSEEELTRIEIPVTLNFPTGTRRFILREANGDIACRYRNYFVKRTTLVDGKPSNISEIADIGPLLIHWCIQEVLEKEDGTTQLLGPPSLDEIRGWKPSILSKLQKTIEDISELGSADETLEELFKQREELNEKITELEKNGDPSKND